MRNRRVDTVIVVVGEIEALPRITCRNVEVRLDFLESLVIVQVEVEEERIVLAEFLALCGVAVLEIDCGKRQRYFLAEPLKTVPWKRWGGIYGITPSRYGQCPPH